MYIYVNILHIFRLLWWYLAFTIPWAIPLSNSFAKLLDMALEPRCKILDRWNQVIEDPASPWKGWMWHQWFCNLSFYINFLKLDPTTCCYTHEKESNICSSSTNLVVLKSTFSDEPGTFFGDEAIPWHFLPSKVETFRLRVSAANQQTLVLGLESIQDYTNQPRIVG